MGIRFLTVSFKGTTPPCLFWNPEYESALKAYQYPAMSKSSFLPSNTLHSKQRSRRQATRLARGIEPFYSFFRQEPKTQRYSPSDSSDDRTDWDGSALSTSSNSLRKPLPKSIPGPTHHQYFLWVLDMRRKRLCPWPAI